MAAARDQGPHVFDKAKAIRISVAALVEIVAVATDADGYNT